MSAYTTLQLSINDGDCLKEALTQLGYVFEEHQVAQQLEGYEGKMREQLANIIIRRANIGAASNDVGFLKAADGHYDLVISDFDRHQRRTKENLIEKLQQQYGTIKFRKQVKRMGYTIASQKVDAKGRIKIKVMVP